MPWLALCTYFAAHLLLYAAIFRRWPAFRTEKGILFYHIASASGILMLAVAGFLASPSVESFAMVIGIGAAHGIYSLSFLEIWVLSEGGYSLRVLAEIAGRKQTTAAEIERHFIPLSARKKAGRLDSLMQLGLVERVSARFQPTPKGAIASRVVATLASVTRSETG